MAANLTDEQKNLLRLLVSQHDLHNQAEFLLARSHSGAGLAYSARGPTVSVPYGDSDFEQLRDDGLITFTRVQQNVHRGKPTQRGIGAVRDFSVDDATASSNGAEAREGAHERTGSAVPLVWQSGEEPMSSSQFWKERQADFEKYTKEFAALGAHWRAAFRVWLFTWGARYSISNVPEEPKDVFNAIARRIATELPNSGVKADLEPWQLWLDYMRVKAWGFKLTGSRAACTEKEWDDGVAEGKSLVELRREQKYTTGDEWTKVYERTNDGTLRLLSVEELEGKSSEGLHKYYHWLEDGVIENIFASSARFCEDLAARAYEMEATLSRAKQVENSSEPLANVTTEDPEFWQRAEHKFRRLQPTPPRPGEVQSDSHNGLGATWYPWREVDKWVLRSASGATMKFFSDAAESAAVELGHPGGPTAVSYWLDLLKVDSPYCKSMGEGFEIYRLCDASAEFCLRLETVAKLNKRNRPLATLQSSNDQQQPPSPEGRADVPSRTGDARDMTSEAGIKAEDKKSEFPERAAWLAERLRERAWTKHDVYRHRGPDHKTVQKILDGQPIREDVLDKLARALSNVDPARNLPKVTLLDIPPR